MEPLNKSFYFLFTISIALYAMPAIINGNNAQAAEALKTGKQVYDLSCVGCHAAGVLEAPKLGSRSDWVTREQQGFETLAKHAINGFKNMPAKGGNPAFKNEEIKFAISYILSQSGFEKYSGKTGEQEPGKSRNTAARELEKKNKKIKSGKNVNKFNRLMKPPSAWNPPPMKDGIHDPENDGTEMLQAPKIAFQDLPKSRSGNRVDWGKALHDGEIAPRYDLLDSDTVPVLMDLNIVREVKGSMPNVVYPHKQHTEWLDCSNCHPAIFIPKKGANQISMASILLGQQCGVCHGKVAFPVSECRKCHSQSK
jgi:c(7)-type cytochrome triheme protein